MDNLLIIGPSTGGPKVLPELFRAMPLLQACIVLIQHMPLYINASFAGSMARTTAMHVKIAGQKERLQNGVVMIAPSALHTRISNGTILLTDDPPVNFVRPSIDVAMLSLKPCAAPRKLVGVVLTGMGCDGAQGLKYMKQLGAVTIAQDEASSAVFGMPAAAIKTGAVDHVLPPLEIARLLGDLLG